MHHALDRSRADRRDYLTATLGAVIGGIGLGITWACVGSSLGAGAETGTGLWVTPFSGQLIGMLFGFVVGLILGEALGCWLALRRAGYPNAGATASLLAILVLAGFSASYFFLIDQLVDYLARYIRRPDPVYVYHGVLLLLLLAVVPSLARLVANWLLPET